ncbi:F6A14.6 protein [Striga asiatica]|uniref:F6A14.6 protein n=1 Tax=Striga asiatica TaxID=4170 RepID=A0A5A7QXA9_STRAF|nr:F6A14.6 protein [Striga asiatica]
MGQHIQFYGPTRSRLEPKVDHELIELGQKFFKKLTRKLKDANSFSEAEFMDMLTLYLENSAKKVGISFHFDKFEPRYACNAVEKLGFLMAKDVKCLIAEGSVALSVCEMLEALIINGLVDRAFTLNLINKLIEKQKSDLIVSCVKHLPDLQAYDMMCILKYFLMLPVDGYESLVSLRKDWESHALLSIDKASGKGVKGKEKIFAKEAVMLAYDGFSVSELCLRYFLACPNLDEVMFSACVGKLDGEEIKALVRYLKKWLEKYERFPQVGPCHKGSSVLGVKVCEWVPFLETVVKCLCVIVDEHFSFLVLHSEFGELRTLEGVVGSLAAEVRLCSGLATLAERLRDERKAYDHESPGNFAF